MTTADPNALEAAARRGRPRPPRRATDADAALGPAALARAGRPGRAPAGARAARRRRPGRRLPGRRGRPGRAARPPPALVRPRPAPRAHPPAGGRPARSAGHRLRGAEGPGPGPHPLPRSVAPPVRGPRPAGPVRPGDRRVGRHRGPARRRGPSCRSCGPASTTGSARRSCSAPRPPPTRPTAWRSTSTARSSPAPSASTIALDPLFAETATLTLGGRPLPTLGPVPTLLAACYQASISDNPPRLAAACDLAQIVTHDPPPIDEVLAEARRWRATAVVTDAFARTWRTLDLPPDPFVERWTAEARATPLERLLLQAHLAPGYVYWRHLAALLVLPGFEPRVRYALGHRRTAVELPRPSGLVVAGPRPTVLALAQPSSARTARAHRATGPSPVPASEVRTDRADPDAGRERTRAQGPGPVVISLKG